MKLYTVKDMFDLEGNGYTLSKTFPSYNMHGSTRGKGRRVPKFVKIWIKGDDHVAELQLTKGKSCLIDLEDLETVCEYNWFATESSRGFGVAAKVNHLTGRPTILLHQLLSGVGFQEGLNNRFVCDHINIDYPESYQLDNRRCNLRVVSLSENMLNKKLNFKNNTSGVQCVHVRERDGSISYEVCVRRESNSFEASFSANLLGTSNSYKQASIMSVLLRYTVRKDFTRSYEIPVEFCKNYLEVHASRDFKEKFNRLFNKARELGYVAGE